MRRLLPPLILVALSALHFGTAPPAYAANEKPQLTQLGTHFPARSFVLTLPEGRTVPPGSIVVSENGDVVSRVRATPADAAGDKDLGVVLVIDATETMRGRAIKDAVAAARAFVAKRNPQQQIGVVTFNRTASVALPPTANADVINAVLNSEPPLVDDGTHIYDAVSTATAMLQKAGINGGSIVLLSDGADTGSSVTAERAAAAAQAAGVRVFTVGLRSRHFDGSALEQLASAGNGDYSEARSSESLGPIYAALGSRLAHEYVLRYRSLAKLGSNVHVVVTAAGLEATSDYVAPVALLTAQATDTKKNFWASSLVLVIVSVICALLIGLAIVALLLLRPRTDTVQDRVRGFVPLQPEPEEDKRPATKGKMLVEAERSLEQTKWWARVKEEIDVARIKKAPVQVLALTAIGTVAVLWILFAITGSTLAAFIALGTPAVVWSVIRNKAERQRKLFADQLADNLQVIASAMRAGHSFVGALTVAVDDSPEPARSEFRRAVADEKLGVPLDAALGVIVDRMRSRDLEQVVLVAMLQRETGGNTAEVLDRVSDTIRYRADLRRTVRTLTTQGRMARWIVSALPPSLLGIVSLINPGYMTPLINTSTGHILLALGAAMVIGGSLAIKKIVNIEV